MAGCQFGDDLRQRQALYLEQQQAVIQKVGGLADDLLIGLRHRGQCEFQSFFTDFLRNAPNAARE